MSAQLVMVLNDDGTTHVEFQADGKKQVFDIVDPYQIAALDAVYGAIGKMIQHFQFLDAQVKMQKFFDENPELKEQMEAANAAIFSNWQQAPQQPEPVPEGPPTHTTNAGYL